MEKERRIHDRWTYPLTARPHKGAMLTQKYIRYCCIKDILIAVIPGSSWFLLVPISVF